VWGWWSLAEDVRTFFMNAGREISIPNLSKNEAFESAI